MASLALPSRPRRHPALPRRSLTGTAVALALAQHGAALAAPAGASVAAGQVVVSNPAAAQTVVTQSSDAAIVNWNSFSVAAAERVDFRQPGAASVILNRVGTGIPSEILGQLSANGRVFLVNPSGVLFGAGAQVDVGGLVASTLDIGDADFLAGRYRFTAGAGPAAGVSNLGRIGAAERGTVALLGATVNNDGVITARLGTVAMAAGSQVTLDFSGDGLTKLRVDQGTFTALVANRGMVMTDGGQAIMTAQGAEGIVETVLDHQGVIQARSLVERNGRILLDGGDSGLAVASGTLDVSGTGTGRRGGEAQVLGHNVGLTGNALVDARGSEGGGTILVGGDEGGANPAVRNADAVFAGPATRLDVGATGAGPGGKVVLWSTNATRVFGTVSAAGGPAGGDGGAIGISGGFLDLAGSTIGAPAGRWLLAARGAIIGGANPPNGNDDSLNFAPDTAPLALPGADVAAALNAGTSVSVSAGDPAGAGSGDIDVEASIQKTSGADATLTLNAARDITIFSEPQTGTPVVIGASAGGGRLNVDLNADTDGVDGGAIFMASGTSIASNGGNVRMYGQGDPAGGRASARTDSEASNNGIGVYLVGATIDTRAAAGVAGGDVLIRGRAVDVDDGVAVRLEDAVIAVGDAGVGIDGLADATGTGTATGVSIGNFNADDPTDAVSVAISTNSGPVTITGSGALNGVELDRTEVRANLSRDGQPPGPVGARLAVTGTGGGNGISLLDSSLANYGGAIDVRGRAGFGAAGVSSVASSIAALSGTGAISVSGESGPLADPDGPVSLPAPGLDFDADSVIGGAGTSGDITLRALNTGSVAVGFADMIRLAGTVRSTGTLALFPGGVSGTGALTEAPAVPIDLFASSAGFSLDAPELTGAIQPGFARVTIGSAGHTGPITASGGAPFAGRYALTLQNGGAGSQGIALPEGLSNPGQPTLLSSGGAVTQGGPINSASLLLHGTQPGSRFLLTNPANAVGRFSAHFEQLPAAGAGTVNFVNSGDLDVGPLDGAGFDAAANTPQPIAAPNAVVAGDLLLQTSGNLVLNQDIATLASNITLVAGGVLDNAAGHTLAPGAGGTWTVFAGTWIGEQAGPLAGTGPTPNLYNCAFGAPCAAALPAGNHFVYRQQPRVELALVEPNPARTYGGDNPAFPFTTSGLVKGDTAQNALSGAYATAAGPASNVQGYPILGSFTSPAGYQVVAAPGLLRVDPAVLTYVATPASRLQGRPNPPLEGSVTGLVAGDTLASATTGTPAFASAADPGAAPGRYPVVGGGLAAVNYVFQQAPGNASALAVVPSPETVFRPDTQRDLTFANTELYGPNIGLQRSCAGTGPLARADVAGDAQDALAIDWSRVRDNPNLSNCIGVVRRYSCDSF
ncbi:MAG: filamentous hemagglutinin N-terminal domain-containing protein [Telluria sp.]